MPTVVVLCGLDVGQCEVPPLEQKRLASSFRQRVGEAVAEVQSRRVVAFAESPPSPARGLCMLSGDRRQLDQRSFHEDVELMPARGAAAALENDGRLQEARDRHAAT